MGRKRTLVGALLIIAVLLLIPGSFVMAQGVKVGGQDQYNLVYYDKVTIKGVTYYWQGPERGIPKHYWFHVGDSIYSLHFGGGPWQTKPDMADKLLYIAEVRLGYFTRKDQPEEPGFTHWHQLVPVDSNSPYDPEIGAWFRHIAVDSFEITFAPLKKTWKVEPGIDMNFLPTPPPK